MARPTLKNLGRLLLATPFLLAAAWLGGCSGGGDAGATSQLGVAISVTPAATEAAAVRASSVVTGLEVVASEPLSRELAAPPVRLQIPQIKLDVPVEPMGWAVVMVNGQRTTLWQTPADAAGWHVNSAGAGSQGRTVISGRQTGEGEVFAPIALGSVKPGQELLLTGADGVTFVYKVSEVTDPLPIAGATAEEEAQAAAYVQPTDQAQLILISGWPDFTTTHRVFVIADYTGVAQ